MPDLIPATLEDLLTIKTWTWIVGKEFFLKEDDDTYSKYIIDDNWNDRIIYDPDVKKPDKGTMFVESKGVGYSKGSNLCQYIDAGICFIKPMDKFIKPLTSREIKKNIIKKFTTGTVDF